MAGGAGAGPAGGYGETPRPEGEAEAPPTFKVIWCYEHCFKSEAEDFRGSLSEEVRARGGRLICLKKAAKFEQWLETQTPPLCYLVLMVAWREAKGCFQVATQTAPELRPSLYIVLCETAATFERASEWLNRNPVRAAPVRLLLDVGPIRPFVDGLASLARRSASGGRGSKAGARPPQRTRPRAGAAAPAVGAAAAPANEAREAVGRLSAQGRGGGPAPAAPRRWEAASPGGRGAVPARREAGSPATPAAQPGHGCWAAAPQRFSL